MTNTLEVPGAVLTYDVRSNGSGTEPVQLDRIADGCCRIRHIVGVLHRSDRGHL